MDDTLTPTTTTTERPATADQCDVCGHAADEHDRVSRRYCAATLAHALTRRCICG